MTFTVFASGSSANCSLLSDGTVNVLLDMGISLRQLEQALSLRGLTPGQLSAVLVTHEHTDHISGLPVLCKKYQIPVYAPRTAANRIRRMTAGDTDYIRELTPEQPFSLDTLTVTAFPTPHDTEMSVGYRIEGGGRTFGLCTDAGCITDTMRRYLAGCGCALIECNHDIDMLKTGKYPYRLRQRILSDRGHLSNERGAELAEHIVHHGGKTLILGHLSRENNTPELARSAVEARVRGSAEVLMAPVWGFVSTEVPECSVSR